jgi:hypothetical protein
VREEVVRRKQQQQQQQQQQEAVPAPANISVKTAGSRGGQLEIAKTVSNTRRGSNFRPFWLESNRFYPTA